MGTGRVQAFSDGVIAIIITIMVLELQVPREANLAALVKLSPVLLSYVLSFVVVAIMWVNHHHLLHRATRATARLLWANNILLFWMSLIPFVTRYLGMNSRVPFAVALYGAVLTCNGAAFTWLRYSADLHRVSDPEMTTYHLGMLRKSAYSTVLYAVSVPLAYMSVYVAFGIFVLIPVLYFLPERRLAEPENESAKSPSARS